MDANVYEQIKTIGAHHEGLIQHMATLDQNAMQVEQLTAFAISR